MSYISRVNQCFRKEYGVYYILQFDIGQTMLIDESSKMISYSTYCFNIKNSGEYRSDYRLINLFIGFGRGERINTLDEIIIALSDFLNFLDKILQTNSLIYENV